MSTASLILGGLAALTGAVAAKLWDLVADLLRERRREVAEVTTAEISDATALRQELWHELELRDQRIDKLQVALEQAKREALDLLRKYNELEVDHAKLKHEHEELQVKHDELHARLARALVTPAAEPGVAPA